jgi:23S rRNA (adenine2503-C2)-methyltransferase
MQRSEDGTVKNAVRLHDGLVVECFDPQHRTTACVEPSGLQFWTLYSEVKRMRNLNLRFTIR